MATSSKRALWKGAISFGLVHIPIALHAATADQGLDFDWLDKRSMDPVGYKRVNKTTGKEITKENIVKGIEYEDGRYVVLTPEEITAAYPKTTQTVEIEAFVSIDDIPFVYLERPYYISPINRGAKVYALLREVLRKSGKVGVAKVVIQTKQHLAVLMPCGPALILNLLRWDDEIRSWDDLDLPAEGTKSTGLTEKELAMGQQLVDDMTAKWEPEQFTDSFREQILHLVKEKVAAGDTESVTQPEEEDAESTGATIYDLTEMLQRSLNKGKGDVGVTGRTQTKAAGKPASKTTGKEGKSSAEGSSDETTSPRRASKASPKGAKGKTKANKGDTGTSSKTVASKKPNAAPEKSERKTA